ncbi:hypothetical protein HN371_00505, partial [Candidatus Poribacteria bacterium]|nr:hypothetical protein [Candidatus Poribacteria bacterium]
MVANVGATATPSIVWAAPFLRNVYDGAGQTTAITDAVIQSDTSLTVETWFRTNTHGVILGYQADAVGGAVVGHYTPALYVGTDGLLRGKFWYPAGGSTPVTTGAVVNDGAWHHVALIGDDDQSTMYLDGTLVGVGVGPIDHLTMALNQIGGGYTLSWPGGNGGWHYFGGEIGGLQVWDGPVSSSDVASFAAIPPDVPAVAWSTSTGAVTTYDGTSDYTAATDALIQTRAAFAVETWFRTTETRGGLFGYQDQTYPTLPSSNLPALYVHSDGRLGGALWSAANPPMFSPSAVNDGAWHHVALVGDVDRHHMYVDGGAVGTYVGPITDIGMDFNQVGLAYTNWVGGASTWDFFRGDISDFNVWDGTLTAADVATIAAVAPATVPANLTGSFAGGADYLDVGADVSLEVDGEYTLEAWIRPTGSGANAGNGGLIIGREGEYLLAWWPADNSIRYATGNDGFQWRNTLYTTPVGAWRHVALTVSNVDGMFRLYADGVEVYTSAGAGGMVDAVPAQNNTRFGERQAVAESFEGDIDEIRIWNVTRSAAEILSTYSKTLSAAEAAGVTGLVGYWNFDDGTATDLSANANDGTFTGQAAILGSQQGFGVNSAVPVADALATGAVNGATNSITITGSDEVGDYLTFALTSATSATQGIALTLTDDDPTDNAATVAFFPTVDGADTFSFTVTDGVETSAAATVTFTVAGATNYAASFDGATDYVNAGTGDSLIMTDTFTLEAWIHPLGPGSGTHGMIVGREGEYLLARFPDGTIRSAHSTNPAAFVWTDTGYVAPLDTWTHIAQTYDSAVGTVDTYANGLLVDSYTPGTVGPIIDASGAQNDLQIGNRQGGEQAFDGFIDEVRVWNVARAPQEILNTYTRSLTAGEALLLPGLAAYWNFDDQTANDITPNGNTGVLTGDATLAPSAEAYGGNGVGPAPTSGIAATMQTSHTVAIQISGSDADGDAVAFALVSPVSDLLGVALTLTDVDSTDDMATVSYTATAGAGPDSFSFTVTDGVETSAAEAVAVTVNLPGVAWATSTGVVTMLDGVGDYEDAPDDTIHSRTDVTVETWFRTTATNGVLFGYQGGSYPSTPVSGTVPALYTSSDGLLRGGLWPASTGAPLNSGAVVNDGSWHHVALVGDTVSHHLYVDGVLSGTQASAIDHLAMTGNQVGVGWDGGWLGLGAIGWDFWRGDIADFNVWDGALTAADVATIHATPPTQEVPNLTASVAGTADFINVGADASLVLTDEMTVEAWIYPTALGSGGASGGTIISKEGEYTIARWGDGSIYYALATLPYGYAWVSSGQVTPLETWSHFAVTYSSVTGLVETYINGVPGSPNVMSGAIGDADVTRNDIVIGEREISPHAFDGEIDEIRVWNVARTAEEISNAYAKSLTPTEIAGLPGLVAYWTFDDGTANDLTSNANHGTFSGQAGIVGSPEAFATNTPPSATSGLTSTVFTDETGQVFVTGADADGDLLSFATTAGASDTLGASLTVVDVDTTDNLAAVDYAATAIPGADTFSFTVSDGIATSAAEVVNVTSTTPTNRALLVDGDLDYVNAAESASLALTDAFTLEAWVYPTGPGSEVTSGGVILGRAGEYLLARYPDGTIRFAHGMATPGYTWFDTGAVAPLNTWTHIAQTYDASRGTVDTFENGTPVGTPVAGSGAIIEREALYNELRIGARQGLGQAFDGKIDEARVWNVARTSEEIANAYDKTLNPSEATAQTGLVGYWTFDDAWPVDLSAQGNHGTLEGGASLPGSFEVYPANTPPTATAGSSGAVEVGLSVDITVGGGDGDGDTLSFALVSEVSGVLGATVTLSDADPTDNTATIHYTADAGSGADTVAFTVSDGISVSSIEVASVTASLPANSAVVLDGVDDYVDIPAHAALDVTGDATIEAWFRTPITITAQTDFAALVQRVRTAGTNDDNYGIVVGDGEYLRFLIGTDTIEQSVDTVGFTAAVNTWYHVAGVYDASVPEVRVYIDGVLNNAAAVTITPTAADGALQIGHTSYPGTPVYYTGDIDDVRLWSVARTQEEIANASTKLLTGTEAGLSGYWNFDDTSAGDLTVNGNAGSFLGGASTASATPLALEV